MARPAVFVAVDRVVRSQRPASTPMSAVPIAEIAEQSLGVAHVVVRRVDR